MKVESGVASKLVRFPSPAHTRYYNFRFDIRQNIDPYSMETIGMIPLLIASFAVTLASPAGPQCDVSAPLPKGDPIFRNEVIVEC